MSQPPENDSAGRFESILQAAEEGVWLIDREARTTFVNPKMAAILGTTVEELEKAPVFDFIYPEDLPVVQENLSRRQRGVREVRDSRLRRKDGSPIWVLVATNPLYDAAGNYDGAVAMVTDITERKRMEDQLRRQRDDYELIFNLVPAQIWVKDDHNRFLRVNQQVERDLGMPASSLVGRTAEEVFPAYAERYYQDDLEVLRSGIPKLGIVEEVNAADGSIRKVRTDKIPYKDASGRTVGLVAIVQDVTEREALQAQLAQASKMEAIGQLAGGIAHDFNNLLTVINGYSQLLLSRAGENDPTRAGIQEIVKAGERAAELTQQLLTFSRRQPRNPVKINLNEVIVGIRSLLQRLIGEHIELVLDLAPIVPTMEADRGQVHQILLNLTSNARDAMPDGGRLLIATREERVGADPGRPWVRMTVADTGRGMDDNVRRRIFEPFFTTKKAGEGTGLGLATVYAIVEQSKGQIDVTSQPGRGTSFELRFPAVAGEPAASIISTKQADAREGQGVVLVVEDQPQVRNLVVEIVQSCGYTPLTAADGKIGAAIAGACAEPILLVITDVVMPRVGGLELMRLVRQSHPRAKGVFISGYTDPEVQQQIVAQGDAFIQKPFLPDQLAAFIHRLMRD